MRVKHLTRAGFVFSFMFVLAVIFSGLASEDTVYAASAIKISKTKMTLCVGETKRLKVSGTTKKVSWSSSNKKVATVSSKGKVKALKAGMATITAKVAGKKLRCKVKASDSIGTYFCLWNVNSDLSPAGRKLTAAEAAEVRRAVNLLVNRTHIAASIVGGGRKPASTFVAMGITEPDGSEFYKQAGPDHAGYYPLKPQKTAAMKILKKYYEVSNGKVTDFPAISYIYNIEGEVHKAIAEYLQSTLKAAGIKLTVIGYDWDTYQKKIKNGGFTMARMGWIADTNDALNFLQEYVPRSSGNFCRLGKGKHASVSGYNVKLKGIGTYKNLKGTWKQTYQKLISLIKKEKKEEIRSRLLHKAEDLIMETGCICPLYYYTQ